MSRLIDADYVLQKLENFRKKREDEAKYTGDREPMRDKLNCPNCGAPITSTKCPYCGTIFYDFATLDNIDNETASGKMNLILKVPYPTKSSFRQERVKQRRQEMETQLNSSKYGIAYIDTNEQVVQLNRAILDSLTAYATYLRLMRSTMLNALERRTDD